MCELNEMNVNFLVKFRNSVMKGTHLHLAYIHLQFDFNLGTIENQLSTCIYICLHAYIYVYICIHTYMKGYC